ncbi:metal-dependent transcriptional regulator [Halanaeroarchaeum sulfurireducens]|uniref:Mn-dependent transcriptional regulator n=2 Tax=Halanaeroarchaeum sulfurireducens TaxID=1604004 RepID=A0A0F7PCE6_9EURY|nr:metal-dependent transcriptional regulator [Halanaeroarchaeum sulfurireducens]AKH97038.1 Mn-dependent transcriptional regulator [Halanaeroarchaeum sulfurireducens]ALG81439.1 Mn-dependent transcriptional regulator [Halanaeroarchaeum sulfurireducens]
MTAPDQNASNRPQSEPSITPKMEDYLRQIYLLGVNDDGWVSNSAIAQRLNVTRASVTSMLETLSDRGLIEWRRYQPIRLTADGKMLALRIVRRHRLAEMMLFELFDYAIGDVDAEADVLEHHLSRELCRAIEEELGMPETDPHGDPIPDVDLDISKTDQGKPLSDVPESSQIRVCRILTQDKDTLDYLDSVGIRPTAQLRLEDTTPIGMVSVRPVDSQEEVNLPQEIASKILVEMVGH